MLGNLASQPLRPPNFIESSVITMESMSKNQAVSNAPQQGESQTAADFIGEQLELEQDAREVLPYVSRIPFLAE